MDPKGRAAMTADQPHERGWHAANRLAAILPWPPTATADD